MSERTQNVAITGLVIFMCSICWGSGLEYGRHQMKRWQDSYYAEHPVVKEVPTFDKEAYDRAYLAGANYGIDATIQEVRKKLGIAPAPPKKAKPAKASKRQLTCKDIGGCTILVPAHPIREQELPPCIVGQEKNRAQDVCCPAYLEVNDCSWHHGTNPREASKP